MYKNHILILVITGLLMSKVTYGQTMPTTYSEHYHGKLMYGLQVPENYDSQKKYPLIMFLHGMYCDATNPYLIGIQWYFNKVQSQHPCFVYTPRCPVSWGSWSGWWEELSDPMKVSLETLDSLAKVYNIDTTRLYVWGISMGGEGTFDVLHGKPGKFAAAMAVCGGGWAFWADKIAKTPFWIFHGGKDNINPDSLSKRVYTKMIADGAKQVRYSGYPNGTHGIWNEYVQYDPAIFDWMFAFSKSDTGYAKPNGKINLSGINTNNEIKLTWNNINNSKDFNGKIWYYKIIRNNKEHAEVMLSDTTYTDSNPTKGINNYQVIGVNYNFMKSDTSNNVSLTTTTQVFINETISTNCKSIKIYPNPASETIKLNAPEIGKIIYNIFSSNGILVVSGQVNKDEAINVKHLCKGLYIIKLLQNNSVYNISFIKK